MTTLKIRLISGLMLASIGVMASGIATASEIEKDMKSMKKNLRSAVNSDSVEELAPYIESLKYSTWHASNLNFDGSEQEKNTYLLDLAEFPFQPVIVASSADSVQAMALRDSLATIYRAPAEVLPVLGKQFDGLTADGDHSHEIKRRLLLGRKVMTKLDSIFKSRDIILSTKSI